jgi:hypothetical protein
MQAQWEWGHFGWDPGLTVSVNGVLLREILMDDILGRVNGGSGWMVFVM